MRSEWLRATLVTAFGLRTLERSQRRLLAEIDAVTGKRPPSREAAIDDVAEARR